MGHRKDPPPAPPSEEVTEHTVNDARAAIQAGVQRLMPPPEAHRGWQSWFKEKGYPLPPGHFDPPADFDWAKPGITAVFPQTYTAFRALPPAEKLVAYRDYAVELDRLLDGGYVALVDEYAAGHTPWCSDRQVVDPFSVGMPRRRR